MGNHSKKLLVAPKIMFKYIFCVFCCLIGLCAYPNDTSGTVLPTGGVVFEKQDGIKMKTEALYIRPGQIEVRYLFENTTDKDITTQVFFPLPQMPAVETFPQGDLAHDYEFKLWVNDKPVKYEKNWTILSGETDITALVPILFYTEEEIISEAELDRRVEMLRLKERQPFIDKNILKYDWIVDPARGEVQAWKMTVDWQKQLSYSWQQTFPAGKTVSVRHTYVPTAMTANIGIPFSKCIDAESPKYQDFVFIPENERTYSWNHLDAQDYVEYILTTANNWQGPIENFNLLVESPLKSVGCFDGEAFYGGQYFAVNRSHYTPEWDISVDFIAKGDIARPYRPKSEPVLYRVDGPANVRSTPNGNVIDQMENDTYVWVWPKDKKGKWYPVLQNGLQGYTHKQNLIKVF